MAGYPIVGNKINVTSSSTGFLNTLFGTSNSTGTVRVSEFSLDMSGGEIDVTGALSAGVAGRAHISGLKEATATVVGFYPKTITSGPAATTPRLGNSSLITYNSSPLKWLTKYSLTFDFGSPQDITTATGSALLWRTWMPAGVYKVTGSYTLLHPSDAVLAMPPDTNAKGVATTFKLTEDGTNDPNFAGSIIIPRGPRFTGKAEGGRVEAVYDFVGDGGFTSLAGDTLPALFGPGDGSTAIGQPEWNAGGDGTPDIPVVFTAYTSRTYTAPCFLTKLMVDVEPGTAIKVTSTIQIAGAIS